MDSTNGARLLVVDDDPALGKTLKKSLTIEGYSVRLETTGAQALKALEEEPLCFDLALVDVRLPDVDGTELVAKLKETCPNLPCVVFTAFGTVSTAVAAMQKGAFDFILKPFPREKLMATIERALERTKLLDENQRLRQKLERASPTVIEESLNPEFRKAISMIQSVAPTGATVLLCGETGTGKERMANLTHKLGPSSQGPFLSVNCAALSESLLESQLFGHVKGAFTGAETDSMGLFERATAGTLFLDEIGDISPGLQAKLLRVLQEKEYLPVGSSTPRRTNARIVAATNKNLWEEVRKGRFREDLLYRLNMFVVEVPALRRRKEDIPRLVARFVDDLNLSLGKNVAGFTGEAMELLTSHQWPGNIRELKNVVERALILCRTEFVDREAIALPAVPNPSREGGIAWPEKLLTLEEVERSYIEEILKKFDGQKNVTAEVLGIGRSTLDRKISRYGLAEAGDQ